MLLLDQSFQIMDILSLNANIALVQYFKRRGGRGNSLDMYPAVLAPNLGLSNVLSAQCLVLQRLHLHALPTSTQQQSYPHLRSKLSLSSHLRYFCEALPRWNPNPHSILRPTSRIAERKLELDSPRPTTSNRQILLESLLPSISALKLDHLPWITTSSYLNVFGRTNRHRYLKDKSISRDDIQIAGSLP